ncbi:MAG: RagB/SusD family nutrient uptake outer membrane protein [Prevotellaceae bacterium]|jgi:hypothetical protein|nr:RagB/SusD family nutrient uptake outer membrane protein [Prevotellaceae bacterium]
MKRIKLYLACLLLTAAATLSSCELESELYSDISPATGYPSTAKDAEELLSSCYNVFSATEYADYFFSMGAGLWVLNWVISDYGLVDRDDEKWLAMMYARWSPESANRSDVNNTWQHYRQLSKMELTIDRIKSIKMDETLKKQYIAELECAQGFVAFMLYDFYGPIPIADLATLKDPAAMTILPRKTEAEMEAYITGKLNSAAAVLPKSNAETQHGRFTAGVAHTLLLKYYMQKRNWPEAVKEGRELQKPEYGYSLVKAGVNGYSPYASIFLEANEWNTEVIWASPLQKGLKEGKWLAYVLPGNYSTVDNCWRMWTAPWSFYDTFEDEDNRKATFAPEYVNKQGDTLTRANPGTGSVWETLTNGPLTMKYPIETGTAAEAWFTDFIVYRYADVLTLLAEALVKNGTSYTEEPLSLLNEVVTRAGLTAYTTADIPDKDKFIKVLLEERAKELYWEGCRRQDLIRNDLFNKKMRAKATAAQENTNIATDDPSETKHYRLPFPASLITESKGAVEQNPY